MKVYLSIPKENIEEILKSGIKMPEAAKMQVKLQEIARPCILAYLSPDDAKSDDAQDVVSIEIDADKVPVAEGVFRKESIIAGEKSEYEIRHDLEKLYYESFTALSKYKLGRYSEPECVITMTIPPEKISKTGEFMDFAVFFEKSSSLHMDCLFNAIGENSFAKNLAIKGYYESMVDAGFAKKQVLQDNIVYKLKDGSCVVLPLKPAK